MSTVGLNTGAESVYFAQPYSLDATGFYFETLEQYQAKAATNRDRYGNPVEEYELQHIDGEQHRLFNAVGVNQANLGEWFELLDELDDDEDRYLIACSLAEDGYAMAELAPKWDDYSIFRGNVAEYAEQIIEECYELPDRLACYLDYERLGRDMVLEGSVTELEREILLIGG
ncbi:antirestriction protein ArdA [Oricola sp.]|uniref:antirestriction protein ArdA n=1 Tax=Oricola sp. TaxID=1979950 RepID=UPI0025D1256B|nr:antirestriction protein ArdA [Oricola sp.]MCI5076434.1 antirestriction protein ArdA [Oricola sp.]